MSSVQKTNEIFRIPNEENGGVWLKMLVIKFSANVFCPKGLPLIVKQKKTKLN